MYGVCVPALFQAFLSTGRRSGEGTGACPEIVSRAGAGLSAFWHATSSSTATKALIAVSSFLRRRRLRVGSQLAAANVLGGNGGDRGMCRWAYRRGVLIESRPSMSTIHTVLQIVCVRLAAENGRGEARASSTRRNSQA